MFDLCLIEHAPKLSFETSGGSQQVSQSSEGEPGAYAIFARRAVKFIEAELAADIALAGQVGAISLNMELAGAQGDEAGQQAIARDPIRHRRIG